MISVAVQGGAMRSIYCVGAVRALVDSGYVDKITAVHSSSAGCVAGSILANQVSSDDAPAVVEIRDRLIERLAGPRFINSVRINKIVDVDYLVQTLCEITSLSVKALARSGTVFEVGVTHAETGRAAYFDISKSASDDDLAAALRATMAIPLLYPSRVKIRDNQYVDGGMTDPLPVLRALRRDPKLLVAVTSRPIGDLAETLDKGLEYRVIKWVPGISTPLRSLMLSMNPLADAVDELISEKYFCGVRVVRISPSDPSLIGSRLEIDRGKLHKLEELGYRDGLAALSAIEVEGGTII